MIESHGSAIARVLVLGGTTEASQLAAALAAAQRGASVLRVHDVAATVDALKVWRVAASGRIPQG